MQSASAAGASPCTICVQPRFHYPSSPGSLVEDDVKYRLFHEPCKQCEDATSHIRLCSHCRHLRLRHHFVCQLGNFHKELRRLIAIVLSPFSSEAAACEFCRLIASYVRKGREIEIEDVEIYFSISAVYFYWSPSDTVVFHALRPSGTQNHLQPLVSWPWLRGWLASMPQSLELEPSPLSFLPRESLCALYVIDVHTSCITRLPPSAQYITLSYIWGSHRTRQFQALQSNAQLLATPGSLESIELPLTIRDAIMVCKHVRQRYLWVDRLCIVQDAPRPEKVAQLEQMADVYHHSVLTLVAAEGEDAEAGLAGVSQARLLTQRHLRFDDEFEIVGETENLETVLTRSKWTTRAWTFQENIASSTLLFFTHAGCFLQRGFATDMKVYAEGPAEPYIAEGNVSGLDIITAYSNKTLTYPNDILRAASGILSAVHGDRTSLGMPWDDFDRAILWSSSEERPLREETENDIFPSWSWVSAPGPVEINSRLVEIYSLAYWGRTRIRQEGIGKWVGIEAPRKHETRYWSTRFNSDRIVVALAWMLGCMNAKAPEWLRLDCSRREFEARVNKQWNDGMVTYWHDAFSSLEKNRVFDNLRTSSLPGRLAVYTQKASFTLDRIVLQQKTPKVNAEKYFFLLRTIDRRVAGSILLDEKSSQRMDGTVADFLLLSVHHPELNVQILRPFLNGYIDRDPTTFYGCPCALQTGNVTARDHIAECPQHSEFNSPVTFPPQRRTVGEQVYKDTADKTSELHRPRAVTWIRNLAMNENKQQTVLKYLAGVSYLDAYGELLHEDPHPPALNVMLVTATGGNSNGTNIYQRLGIGHVYLKRWVEASPRFETSVLR